VDSHQHHRQHVESSRRQALLPTWNHDSTSGYRIEFLTLRQYHRWTMETKLLHQASLQRWQSLQLLGHVDISSITLGRPRCRVG
jgi:hypothetical protein